MHFRDVCTKQCTLSTIGLILSCGSLVFAISWLDIFYHMLGKEMALRPNSHTYDIWKTPPIPLSLDIYFFNWTNPQDFITSKAKPILQQIGPYRFTENKDKVDITWHPENASVSFKMKSTYYFDEANSAGRLNDSITTVNVVALSAATKAKHWGLVLQNSVSVGLTLYSHEISVTKSVDELLFKGYSDDMIDVGKELAIFGENFEVPFDRFGWFYTRNNSADLTGHYNIFTGEDDIEKIGQMHTWNYKKTTDAFASYCGMVNGSAGEFYPPNLREGSTISLFTADMCRTLNFDHTETVKVKGIEGYKFSGTPRSIDNGTSNPENKCFCVGDCAPSGVMNISACRFGAPVYMSYPHYYNADPFFINQVDGLNPSQDKHEFYIILEPVTGIPLEVAARFQINVYVERFPNIALYKNIPSTYFPVIWFESKVTIEEYMAADLRKLIPIPTIAYICAGIIFSIGLIMISWIPIDRLINRKRVLKSGNKPKKDEVGSKDKVPEVSPLLKRKCAENSVTVENANEKKPNVSN